MEQRTPITSGETGADSLRRKRNTRQRQAVLEAIQTLAGKHPTAAEVYSCLHDDHPNLSLATVYRALHALTEDRAILEMRVENVARYDAGPEPHHHFICRECGQVADLSEDALPNSVTETLLSCLCAAGFAADPFPLQFIGLCALCQKPPDERLGVS